MKTSNFTKEKFLSLLNSYTIYYIDNLLSNYKYIRLEDEKANITNEISRIIIKHNLEEIYSCLEPKKYKFTVDVGNKADKEFTQYNHHALNNVTTTTEELYRFAFKHPLKRFLVRDFWSFYYKIKFNKDINNLLNGTISNHLIDFEALFDLFKDMNLNSQDMLDTTLYIMTLNINNGILEDEQQDPLMEPHRLIRDNYNGMENLDDTQICPIITALEYLNYPNIETVIVVLNKRIEKEQVPETPQPIVKEKPVQKKNVYIEKSLYNDGIKKIAAYYDIEDNSLTKRLSVNEIVYVVGIMQSLKFDDEVVNRFLKTAYKRHKDFSPIDRYLDLSAKIDYFRQIDDVEAIHTALKEIFREYTLASNDKDKEFWLNSLDEELSAFDNIAKDNYVYELTKNKPQE